MFWDAILDPVRNLLSNDISEWIVASLLVALISTKLANLICGSSFRARQEINFGVAVFLVLFGVFYLP